MYSTYDLKSNLLGRPHTNMPIYTILICILIFLTQIIVIYLNYNNNKNEYIECLDIIRMKNISFDCNEHFKQINCYINLISNPDVYINKTYICH